MWVTLHLVSIYIYLSVNWFQMQQLFTQMYALVEVRIIKDKEIWDVHQGDKNSNIWHLRGKKHWVVNNWCIHVIRICHALNHLESKSYVIKFDKKISVKICYWSPILQIVKAIKYNIRLLLWGSWLWTGQSQIIMWRGKYLFFSQS